MENAIQDEKGVPKTTLVLRVKYAPVKQPMVQPGTDGNTTLAQVKVLALAYFGLTEGEIPGGSKTYVLSHDGVEQTDLTVKLDSLADHGHQVELLLLERFIQG
jgi:putative intracellular protease/amidase